MQSNTTPYSTFKIPLQWNFSNVETLGTLSELKLGRLFQINLENNRECEELKIICELLGQNVEYSNKMADMCNVLNV